MTRRHLALRSLLFDRFFYLPFEAPWENTKKMERPREKGTCNAALWQEPMSRSMQLHYTPVTAFSKTDLSLDRISSELDSYGSAMTNLKALIDVTASLDQNCLSFTKKKKRCSKKRSVCKNAVT